MRALWIVIPLAAAMAAGGCCDPATVAMAERHATVMHAIAEELNARGAPADPEDRRDMIAAIENQRRAAQNIADRLGGREETYSAAR